MASHQRRPETYRAEHGDSVYLLDSIRPLTHAVIATRDRFGPEYSVNGYTSDEAARIAAKSIRDNDYWTSVVVVPVVLPATTFNRPQMSAADFHATEAR